MFQKLKFWLGFELVINSAQITMPQRHFWGDFEKLEIAFSHASLH